MTIAELIKKLQEYPENHNVFIEYQGSGGCGTCGYGDGVEAEIEVEGIVDLETKVIISV